MPYDDEPIIEFIKKNNIKAVEEILNNKIINPSQDDNYALCPAALYNRYDIVKLLLEDKRANPADNHNYPIIIAYKMDHKELCALLWQDKRVQNSLEKDDKILYNKLLSIKIKNNIKGFIE